VNKLSAIIFSLLATTNFSFAQTELSPLDAANTYEELPKFKASEILRPEFLQGAIGITNFSQPDAWLTASQRALRARIRGDALLNKLIEFSQINRFDEMILESGLAGLSDIFFHPKTGQSDSNQRAGRAYVLLLG
jgi:hypothetical protein